MDGTGSRKGLRINHWDQDSEEEKTRKWPRLWTVERGVKGGVQWAARLFYFKMDDQSIMHMSSALAKSLC